MMAELTTDLSDGVFTMTFNRPSKKNAISQGMLKTIISELLRSSSDDNVRVAVLTGVGNFYSSGNDFSTAADLDERLSSFKEFVAALIDYPKILVAVVNGPAIGMACTTLALCDFVFASDNAYLQTPFTRLGLVAEGCSSYTFPRIFGNAKAASLLYMNEKMSTKSAELSGFVTMVFPHHELHQQSFARIRELASLPLKSLIMTKKLIRREVQEHLHRANHEEVNFLLERFNSSDFMEALSNTHIIKAMKNKL